MKLKQSGFTLIELLIAMAIAGLLAIGISVAISQIFNVNSIDNARIQAVKQVENALHYINRDAQMAQTVAPQGSQGFPLTLSWVAWDSCDSNQVTYTLQNGNLIRQFQLNSEPPTNLTVARSIDGAPENTNCVYSAVDHQLTVTLTSSFTSGSKQATETRVSDIIPRSGS